MVASLLLLAASLLQTSRQATPQTYAKTTVVREPPLQALPRVLVVPAAALSLAYAAVAVVRVLRGRGGVLESGFARVKVSKTLAAASMVSSLLASILSASMGAVPLLTGSAVTAAFSGLYFLRVRRLEDTALRLLSG